MSRYVLVLISASLILSACGGKVLETPVDDRSAADGGDSTESGSCELPDGTLCSIGSWCDQPDTCERCYCDETGLSCEDSPCGQDASPVPEEECVVPSNGCDFCGNLTCPEETSIDSACRCITDDHTYVMPVSQTCDFCCGKTCSPGQFLDFECKCYGP